MGGNLAPFGTGTYALDWLWAVVFCDWSSRICFPTPFGAIIRMTYLQMEPAFPFVPSQDCQTVGSVIGPMWSDPRGTANHFDI